MRYYGEVDAAIAVAGGPDDRRNKGNDFSRLFDDDCPGNADFCGQAEQKLAWNEALRAAKALVNEPPAALTSVKACEETSEKVKTADGNLRAATYEVHMTSTARHTERVVRSINVTCNTNKSVAIHLWM